MVPNNSLDNFSADHYCRLDSQSGNNPAITSSSKFQCSWGAIGVSIPAWLSRVTFAVSTYSSLNLAMIEAFYFFGFSGEFDDHD